MTVSGAADARLNGTFVVTGTASTTLSFTIWGTPSNGAVGGTADVVVHGYAGGLKSYLGGASYARAVAGLGSGSNVASATDAALAPYADNYYEYNSGRRVTTTVIQGAGCSSCTGGLGEYGYQFGASGLADDYNNWSTRSIETLPDGNRDVVYSNYAGQTILKLHPEYAAAAKTVSSSFTSSLTGPTGHCRTWPSTTRAPPTSRGTTRPPRTAMPATTSSR